MSGYNNSNENNYFGNNYVNFDQFLMQHNIGGQANFFSTPPLTINYNNHNMLPQQQQPAYDQLLSNSASIAEGPMLPAQHNQTHAQPQYFNNELALNSNLVPTANEFVPQYTFPSLNTNLMATANEFIPKSSSSSAINEAVAYSSSPINFFGSPLPVSNDNLSSFQMPIDNNNEVLNDCAPLMVKSSVPSAQPSSARMLTALSISDGVNKNASANDKAAPVASSNANGLSVNGGAIKKIRNTYSRDSRKSNSNELSGARNGTDYKERSGG